MMIKTPIIIGIIMISCYIYSSSLHDQISNEKLMPYSNVYHAEKEDYSIIEYGVKKMESRYKVPDEVSVRVDKCSSNVAGKYNTLSKSIVICKAFIEYIKNTYKHLELEDYEKSLNATILFVLYHEFGHMFKDVYDLPIVGNEEIAADQFAALMLLEDNLLYNHLEAYKQMIDMIDKDIPAWDEHPSYKQQYYNLACMLYGYDKLQYSMLASELEDRAERCGYEYNTIQRGWSMLLNNHR